MIHHTILQSGKQRRLKSEKQLSSKSFNLMENILKDTSYEITNVSRSKRSKNRRLSSEGVSYWKRISEQR